ncbi:MAG TPA: DUF2079 domain-containing protein [Candidatus Paceibacterota bacterium]|nr:DUF2079 domain-containing protein [Candidatus Paceibacterota bacterium]
MPRFYALTLAALYLALVVFASAFSYLKIESLGAQAGQGIDYSYFLQFYAHGLSPDSIAEPQHFPGVGTGMFLRGPDGRDSIQKGIHFEPVKYAVAVLYAVSRSPFFIYIVLIAVFYSPLLYGAWLLRRTVPQPTLVFFVVLLYALSPAALPQAVAELRAFTFVYPLYFMAALAVLLRRAAWERLVLLNLLLATREEMLLLSVPLIIYEYLTERAERIPHRVSALMAWSWAAWVALAAIYFYYIRASYQLSFTQPTGTIGRVMHFCLTNPFALSVEACAALVFFVFIVPRFWKKYIGADMRRIAACVFVVGSLVPVCESLVAASPSFWPPSFVFNRFGYMIALVCLASLVAVAQIKPFPKRWVIWIGSAALVFFLVFQSVGHASVFAALTTMHSQISEAQLVRDARKNTPASQPIIADARTMQAFYDFTHVSVLVPQPAYAVANPQDYYPGSLDHLADIVHADGPVTIVIQRSLAPDIAAVAAAAGKTLSVREENDLYIWYQTDGK